MYVINRESEEGKRLNSFDLEKLDKSLMDKSAGPILDRYCPPESTDMFIFSTVNCPV